MPQKKVAVAMSGGIDSSVAAALLKHQGYQVFGVTMLLYSKPDKEQKAKLKQAAESLGIPHYIIDLRRHFRHQIIKPFCNEYNNGRTPNPCIACNQHIKFGLLLNKVRRMGADYLATGHYARIESGQNGFRLIKGIDHGKDQSYFLYTLGQQQLQYLLLPIGELYKNQTRRIARELCLTETEGHESQDICFVPDNDYRSFVARHLSCQPGDIVDTDGGVLGKHSGLAYYTVGQRQGLGLASDRRLYVLKLDSRNNKLVVGSQSQLLSSRLIAGRLNWVSGKAPQDDDGITARIRYKSPEAPASLRLNRDTAEVSFSQPQRSVSPGQAVVFYQCEEVLGGGIIESSEIS
ncbi:MAG TPA: tRNA 2-thiouridine(34) synthase MnmA [Dehalococcoidia bacterium]|nr:tRNA 2-thiouridine(34) synthase MnmA [Dehalococcoidia bacterium]